ncbi:MAG: CBS domain-containing protein [Acetobacteraceae bacterium]|nr:CBS domain-containing protein [Acetobacteraceae bacterium]
MRDRHLNDLIRSRSPIAMAPDTPVADACRTMGERRVGCVLVTDQGKLVGIFTGRDAVRLLGEGRNPAGLSLADVMTRKLTTLGPKSGALDALRCMQDGGFRHVPIVDGGILVGIVSRGDFRAIEHARLDEETGYWERI